LDDAVPVHFLAVRLGHAFVADGGVVVLAQLLEAGAAILGGGVEAHRDRDQPEADGACPARTRQRDVCTAIVRPTPRRPSPGRAPRPAVPGGGRYAWNAPGGSLSGRSREVVRASRPAPGRPHRRTWPGGRYRRPRPARRSRRPRPMPPPCGGREPARGTR